MQIRAVIFDLDGTLADTLDGIAKAMNATLDEFGLPTHDPQTIRTFVGNGVQRLVERALPPGRRDLLPHVLNAYAPRLLAEGGDHSQPYDGAAEVLDELTRRGMPFSVLSNKPHEPTVDVVARLFPDHRFVEVAGAKPDAPIKPDPTAAVRLCQAMGVSPGECAFVGDSDVDIETGRNAGITTVGCAYGLRSRDELIDAGADHVIDSIGELLELL